MIWEQVSIMKKSCPVRDFVSVAFFKNEIITESQGENYTQHPPFLYYMKLVLCSHICLPMFICTFFFSY